MRVHVIVLMNLLNKLKKDNKFNNTGAAIIDSFYHMPLKLL